MNTVAAEVFHCRLYALAPLTAVQLNSADEDVILPALNPVGTPQTPGTGVVNEVSVENALVVVPQTACAWNSYPVPWLSPVILVDVPVTLLITLNVAPPMALHCTLYAVAPSTDCQFSVADVGASVLANKLVGTPQTPGLTTEMLILSRPMR